MFGWITDLFSDVQQSIEEYPSYHRGYEVGDMVGATEDEIAGLDRLADELGIPEEHLEIFSEGVQDGLDSHVPDDRPWWRLW